MTPAFLRFLFQSSKYNSLNLSIRRFWKTANGISVKLLELSKLYFKNHFKYMGTNISIIILALYIHTARSAILILRIKTENK